MRLFLLFSVIAATATARKSLMSKYMMHKLEAHKTADVASAKEQTENLKKYVRSKGELVCKDGVAGEGVFDYECSNMNLLSVLTGPELGSRGNITLGGVFFPPTDTYISDNWGWVDPQTGKEYALVGMWDGTALVDVSNPRKPKTVGFIDYTGVENYDDEVNFEPIWRDIKVAENVAYIGSEVLGHGVQVFDLARLKTLSRNTKQIPKLEPDTTLFEVGQSHNIVVAPEAKKMMAVGLEGDEDTFACYDASFALFDISSDPVNPTFEECVYVTSPTEGINSYVHDAHCIEYAGPDSSYTGVNICALFAEFEIILYNLDEMEVISSMTYDSFAYVHQGWFSEDQATLYSNDEVDEIAGTVSETSTYIWDVTDLENPTLVDTFEHNVDTDFIHPNIDHNFYIKDGLLYQASYTAGARIRELQADGSLKEVAYFDMEQTCEVIDFSCDPFVGVWNYFPYYDSGITTTGSALQGFFVLRPTL